MKTIFYYLMFLILLGIHPLFYGCGEGGTETGNPTEGENSDDGNDDGEPNDDSADSSGDDEGTDVASEEEEEEACLDDGGEWIEFSNGCVDDCEAQRSEEAPICTQSLTEGCECGEDMCWTGSECEEI